MKKVKFYTFGCKANQYDTQALREKFLRQGFQESQNGLADVYVVNTCIVTQKAENDSRALVERLKRKHFSAEVIIAGCLKHYLAKEESCEREFANLAEERISFFAGHKRAFLKIQDGCDNFCSYCIVPHVRGRARSKPREKIREEFLQLVRNGYREIVLVGICLGDYGRDLVPALNLVELVSELAGLEGEFRIRLSSLDPQYISPDLIETISGSEKICPHLHMPFQSGDNAVLGAMQRRYTREFALDLINRIRKKIPRAAITTDIIVGFPGEGEINFQKTVEFLEFLQPPRVHIFSFSPRSSTPAEKLNQTVSREECRRRYRLIDSLQKKWRDNYLGKFLGRKISVLAEKNPAQDIFSGYSGHYFRAVFQGNGDCLNKLIDVKGVMVREGKLICTL